MSYKPYPARCQRQGMPRNRQPTLVVPPGCPSWCAPLPSGPRLSRLSSSVGASATPPKESLLRGSFLQGARLLYFCCLSTPHHSVSRVASLRMRGVQFQLVSSPSRALTCFCLYF